jgi:succinate-semialdehyde dehydrogenase/glutarate-semialdehyde dehydrogenase
VTAPADDPTTPTTETTLTETTQTTPTETTQTTETLMPQPQTAARPHPRTNGRGVRLEREAPLLPVDLRRRLLSHVVTVGARDDLEVLSPFTERALGAVPDGTAEDVAEAVRRARAAQPEWAAKSFRDRARIVRRFHDLVLARQEEVLDLIQLESGKARAHAFEEVADAAIVAAYYARTAAEHLKPRRREGALPLLTSTREVRHPKGVVGFIAPWNYPLSMAITDAIPALMAGNACVLKPAQRTPFTALWAVDLMIEAGLPADVLTVVTGRGSTLGTPLIEGVDFVTFTGSTETGRRVAEQAARRLIGCALELGGKNALIVLDDADVEAAVDGAVRACFASAGQLCISIERIFVHRSLETELTRRFVDAVERLELSSSLAYGPDMGSLASRDQLETVTRHVEDAKSKGAKVLTGGVPRPDVGPLFFAPTVLSGVTGDMLVASEETFGPVVSIFPFDTDAEAIERANDTPYGLSASVWTTDEGRGAWVAERLEAGTVNVNEAYAAAWASVDAPMGGYKQSGLGRRHGREGITKYTEVQNVATQRLMPVTSMPGLSQARNAKVLTAALRALHRIPGLRR